MVDWQFSDRTGSKRRPAVVVQADRYNQSLDDTILALITSSARRLVGAATQTRVDVSTPEGQTSGLKFSSVIQCENLVTVDQSFILGVRGRLSAALMANVDAGLKAALGLM